MVSCSSLAGELPTGSSVPCAHFLWRWGGTLRRVPRIGLEPRSAWVRGRMGTTSRLGLPISRFGRF